MHGMWGLRQGLYGEGAEPGRGGADVLVVILYRLQQLRRGLPRGRCSHRQTGGRKQGVALSVDSKNLPMLPAGVLYF